jgi:nucleoside-diphosphate-sugar epimerase
MNVLVTGGAGYVGSVVARSMLAHGHEVRVLDSLRYGGEGLLGLYPEQGFHFVRGDIRSAQVVKVALEGMDAVVHLAAMVGDPVCSREPALAREVNQDASLQLFELCRRQGIQRFIFASTCSNYGRMADPSAYLTEESELRPVSLYAETKVAVERSLLDSPGTVGSAVTILRFATVFGLSPRMRFDLTVNEFTMALLVKRKLTLYGEQFWRPYIHVRDAAQAVRLTLEAPSERVSGEAFNAGDTSQNYQKGRLAELIRAQIGNQCEIERVHKVEDPRDYRVSFDKIGRTLGFRMTRTVEAGVREIIAAIALGVITDVEHPRWGNV